ncbi:MAG: undecaprenyldiphospho-muramoylpentapeptide beta-N-acetylglucosaminyltransferase [Tissierellia bacterium]|nr:undecaprenyldiphospho-muramoylpentapeptide beta-N-acetylglucosaminyltransferase [Tissierellia bacterium]
MKIIVSGGGTGGHIYPAISIIEELKKRDENNQILYIGTKEGLESEIVPKLNIDFKSISVKGLPRKINKQSFIAMKELFKGLSQAKKIIKDFNPDVIIGTGGFVSGPVLYRGTKTDAYTAFHEQNSFPGLTNRILSRYVDEYFVTFKESIKYFKNPEKAIVTGNPIRNRFNNIDEKKEEAYKYFNLDKNKKVIFSFGGSNGAKSINENMKYFIENLSEDSNLQVIHVTGKRFYESFIKDIGENANKENVKIYPYMEQMQLAYAITDLIITSSGAITLAEISFLGLPSILIPKAYTTENHQEHNAIVYKNEGAAEVLLEKDITGKLLYDMIHDIVDNPEKMEEMSKASLKLAAPNAAKDIVDKIYDSIESK